MSTNRATDRPSDEKPAKKTKFSGVDGEGNESKPGSAKVGEPNKKRRFLFKMVLTANEVEGDTVFFPSELVLGHFPPPAERISREKLEFVDTKDNSWPMTLTYSPVERAFVITNKWDEFIRYHNLEVADVIKFYRPVNPQHGKDYLINYVRKVEVDDKSDSPDTDDEDLDMDLFGNLLFEMRLTPDDMRNRIAIPEEHVLNHFPEIKKPTDEPVTHDYYFTDDQNKDWCMKTMFNHELGGYVIMDGWESFVKQHKLKDMDVMGFYEPAHPSHAIHFILVIVTKEEAQNLWGHDADESDEEQRGMSESAGSNNQMEIDD
ncbi:unnamed protein product [Camellia sinensis]